MSGRQTPPESPFSKTLQREEKRQAILSEAAGLFNRQGTRATTLGDVAARLGLSKTTLYYYVKSKEELSYRCYLDSCRRVEEMLRDAEARGSDGAAMLAAFIHNYFDAWQAIRRGSAPNFAIFTEIRALQEGHRQEIAERYSRLYKRVRAMVRAGVADHSLAVASDVDTALAVFGVLQLTVVWLPDIEPDDFGRMADEFIDIVMYGVAARDAFEPRAFPGLPDRPAGFDRAARNRRKQEAFCRIGSALFNRKGFKGSSLDEIAAALDVTKGAFYYHVKDKEDLLWQCFKRSLAIVREMQDLAVPGAGTGLEELQLCACYLFQIQNSPDGPLIRFNLIPSLSAAHRRAVLKGIQQVSDRFGAMIERGIADGSIRAVDAFVAEQMLTSAINVCVELQRLRPIGDIPAASRSYFQVFFNGIAR